MLARLATKRLLEVRHIFRQNLQVSVSAILTVSLSSHLLISIIDFFFFFLFLNFVFSARLLDPSLLPWTTWVRCSDSIWGIRFSSLIFLLLLVFWNWWYFSILILRITTQAFPGSSLTRTRKKWVMLRFLNLWIILIHFALFSDCMEVVFDICV